MVCCILLGTMQRSSPSLCVPRVSDCARLAFVSTLRWISFAFSSWGASAVGQRTTALWAGIVSASRRPTAERSSHIFIGESENRRIWTAGAAWESTRALLRQSPHFRLDYEASIPAGCSKRPTPPSSALSSPSARSPRLRRSRRYAWSPSPTGPVGSILAGSGAIVPLYALFGKQNTLCCRYYPIGSQDQRPPAFAPQGPAWPSTFSPRVTSRDRLGTIQLLAGVRPGCTVLRQQPHLMARGVPLSSRLERRPGQPEPRHRPGQWITVSLHR